MQLDDKISSGPTAVGVQRVTSLEFNGSGWFSLWRRLDRQIISVWWPYMHARMLLPQGCMRRELSGLGALAIFTWRQALSILQPKTLYDNYFWKVMLQLTR